MLRPSDSVSRSIYVPTRQHYYQPGLGFGFGTRCGYGVGYSFGYGGMFDMSGRCGYNPWGSGGYGYGATYGYGYRRSPTYVSDSASSGGDGGPAGSIRLRVSPRSAQVYVDGTLVGVVDDFDGLSDHLKLGAGLHQLEIRANGYQPYATDISVTAGRTETERASLKRIK